MSAPLLAVRGVTTYYGKIIALRGVDLDVNQGEIVTLIGANGAGKSTLMMTICASSSTAPTSPGCRRTRSCGCRSRSRPRGGASSRA